MLGHVVVLVTLLGISDLSWKILPDVWILQNCDVACPVAVLRRNIQAIS